MADLEKARAAQLANIEQRTGKTLAQLAQIVKKSGLSKHGELVAMLKQDLGMGHGDANMLVHTVRQAEAAGTPVGKAGKAGRPAKAGKAATPGKAAAAPATDAILDELYTGAKADLRPIHDRLLAALRKLGDFEEAPKKAYVSYRRQKQFVTIGPATRTSVEVGLNVKGLDPTDRLEALPPGKMCSYRVRLGDPAEVDAELVGWLKAAYEAAG